MANDKKFPTHYTDYLRKSAITRRTDALPLLARFCNRYRLAESFEGMIAPDVGKTLVGYDVLTKIFLAYTAYEAVVKAARSLRLRDISDPALNASLNPVLAVRLRENFKLMKYLATQDFSTELKNKINSNVSYKMDLKERYIRYNFPVMNRKEFLKFHFSGKQEETSARPEA